jgi:hypothetical protein
MVIIIVGDGGRSRRYAGNHHFRKVTRAGQSGPATDIRRKFGIREAEKKGGGKEKRSKRNLSPKLTEEVE